MTPNTNPKSAGRPRKKALSRLVVEIPAELHERLRRRAEEDLRPVTSTVQLALTEYLQGGGETRQRTPATRTPRS